ncbi:MAG: DUF4440 domain-containing protein [Planctomycetes bacterium]|nr:DUF4440 domain-containing protein [Planctomycetota bacterium]
MKLEVLLVVPLLAAACRSIPDSRAESLLAADRAFAADTEARRLDGWLAAFDAHGSQVDEAFRPITGRDAITAHMGPFFADLANELTWTPDDARVSEGGKLGTTTGRWKLARREQDGRETVLATGRYFDVWRKQADGSWKLLYDVGDEDAAPAR